MTTERRRYFRINDHALIKYRVVAASELDMARAQIAAHVLRADNLRDALSILDVRLTELGPALRRESRAIADALDLLNRKLDVLAGVFALEAALGADSDHLDRQAAEVNLSGAGLLVQAAQALPSDTWLAIELVLLPANQVMRVIGRVIECRPRAAGFGIGIEFDGLGEQHRDMLVAHVLRKQAQVLRQERGLGQQQL